MRIGVLLSPQPPTVGGGHTFQEDILRTIVKRSDINYKFLFISRQHRHDAPYLSHWDNLIYAPEYCRSADVSDQLTTIVNQLKIDIVWCLGPLGVSSDVPVVVTVFDLNHRQFPYFPEFSSSGWSWRDRDEHYSAVLPRAARIITGTEFLKRLIQTCYAVPEANVVVNPLPTPTFPQCAGENSLYSLPDCISCGNGYLFYPAQFWPHKNHVNLISAMNILRSKYNISSDLVLTGSDQGNMENVVDWINKLSLAQSIHFTGFVPRSYMLKLYSNAAMLVYPSLWGPDNLPPLEAFSLGCPVVVANIEGSAEQLSAEAALFFDPLDPEDIANKIHQVLTTPSLRQSLVAAGSAIAMKRTYDGYLDTIIREIASLAAELRCWSGRLP
jgi:glycosyltransferase involved in cell wall biosynthesis